MLDQKLQQLARSDTYPFHMPGHKRLGLDFPNPYTIDITEIEDFDNLHHPTGIIKEEQERAAALYGSDRCYYLVNGSTGGILAAVSAAARPGERILVARNSHRSVYNAICLRRLNPVYVYPVPTRMGLPGQIRAEDVRKTLAEYPDIRAVVLTSPTYDGVVSNVSAIAETVHRAGASLIVDEAHGAHFGFHEAFPENATRLGADAVVMSVHKTVPAFTQTALLHLCGGRILAGEVERFLDIYETSSPSYVLMAGISRCVDFLLDPGVHGRFAAYAKLLSDFRERARTFKYFRVPGGADFGPGEAFDFDPGKLILDTGDSGMSGPKLKAKLLERGLQTEMAGASYVLAMTSVMDRPEGFARLLSALGELDAEAGARTRKSSVPAAPCRGLATLQEADMEPWRAVEGEREAVSFAAAEGRVSADYISLYPPGTPILVPGERIRGQTLAGIADCARAGLDVEGLAGNDEIWVVKTDEIL